VFESLFRRRARVAAPSAAASPAPAGPAWPTAAPMPRALPAPRTATDPLAFARSLTARTPAPLTLRPPEHAVDPGGLSGRVQGLATIVAASASGVRATATEGSVPLPSPSIPDVQAGRLPTALPKGTRPLAPVTAPVQRQLGDKPVGPATSTPTTAALADRLVHDRPGPPGSAAPEPAAHELPAGPRRRAGLGPPLQGDRTGPRPAARAGGGADPAGQRTTARTTPARTPAPHAPAPHAPAPHAPAPHAPATSTGDGPTPGPRAEGEPALVLRTASDLARVPRAGDDAVTVRPSGLGLPLPSLTSRPARQVPPGPDTGRVAEAPRLPAASRSVIGASGDRSLARAASADHPGPPPASRPGTGSARTLPAVQRSVTVPPPLAAPPGEPAAPPGEPTAAAAPGAAAAAAAPAGDASRGAALADGAGAANGSHGAVPRATAAPSPPSPPADVQPTTAAADVASAAPTVLPLPPPAARLGLQRAVTETRAPARPGSQHRDRTPGAPGRPVAAAPAVPAPPGAAPPILALPGAAPAILAPPGAAPAILALLGAAPAIPAPPGAAPAGGPRSPGLASVQPVGVPAFTGSSVLLGDKVRALLHPAPARTGPQGRLVTADLHQAVTGSVQRRAAPAPAARSLSGSVPVVARSAAALPAHTPWPSRPAATAAAATTPAAQASARLHGTASPGSANSGQAAPAHAWPRPPAPGPSLPDTVPDVQRATADPAAVAVALGLGQPAGDGSVVFAPPVGPAPGVQRQTLPTTSAAPPAPAAPAMGAAPDLTTLTDELYERIERRLRADLLFDRERKGLLADAS